MHENSAQSLAPAKRTLSDGPSDLLPSKRTNIEGERPEYSEQREPVTTDTGGNAETLVESTGGAERPEKRDATHSQKSRRGKAKDDSRRRQRVEGPRKTPEGLVEHGPKPLRLPKRMTALLIGFCGAGYNGMQIQQPPARTIEGILFEALIRAGAISQDNADNPAKVSLSRAARTDAGVHAAGNLVSMKLITTIPGVKDWVAHVNAELPPEIRVWNKVRVQNSFDARLSCDSRKYTYFFPSYLLIPPKPNSAFARAQQAAGNNFSHPFWDFPGANSSSLEEDLIRKREWRVGPEQLQALRATAKKYEGTHNFHNFTIGREFGDRSNQRLMLKIEVQDPAVYGNTEWISILFHGQSFMLHQIRKMMAGLVLPCRTGTPGDIIDELYGPRMVLVPKMPALGLLLEYPIFGSYNRKVTSRNDNIDPSHPDYRQDIDFEKHREAIDIFKQTFIYDKMRETEDRFGIFDAWIRHIDCYHGNDLLYLNPRGIIPPAAVIEKRGRRANAFRESRRFDITGPTEIKEGTPAIADEAAEDDAEENLSKRTLEDMEG
ncbi:pseudouridine synthase [Phlebopus sp. FC_14]|nr:pseudouridine synthase [Phlebopus sp. FC_14]